MLPNLSNQVTDSDTKSRPKRNPLYNEAAVEDNIGGCQREIFAVVQKYKDLCLNFDKWFRLHGILSQDKLGKLLMMYCQHSQTIITRKIRPHPKTNRIFYDFGCYFASQKFVEKGSFKELCPLRVLVSTKPGSGVFKIEAINLLHNHVKIDHDSFLQLYTKILRIPSLFSTNKMKAISSSSYESKISTKLQKDFKRDNYDYQEDDLSARKYEKMDKDTNMVEEGALHDIKIIANDANINQGIRSYPLNHQNNDQSGHDLMRIMDCTSFKASNGIIDAYALSFISPPISNSLDARVRLIIQAVVTAFILQLNQRK